MKSILYAIPMFAASTAFANEECPAYLPAELMTDCIVEYGAGGVYDAESKYKQWRKEQADRLEALDQYSSESSEDNGRY